METPRGNQTANCRATISLSNYQNNYVLGIIDGMREDNRRSEPAM